MPIRDKIRANVRRIAAQLVEHGHEAYLVGGAVRDLLLGIEPKDYDIATSASPEEVRDVFTRRRSRIIGRRFRLAHVYERGEVYEVSTFRREPTAEERCGREGDDGVMLWRDNAYGTLEEDARRRDFTVNALYYDVVGDRGIIDFVGGVGDLESRTVRAIGDTAMRMAEDPVRILRALKLVGLYDFSLEPVLADAVRELGERIRLASPNRLFEELLKIMGNPRGGSILAAFHEHGFLQWLWPRAATLWDSPDGELLRGLLAERGRRMVADGNYPNSKALLLATLLLAPLRAELGAAEDDGMWEYQPGLEHVCRSLVHEFMEPFPISRFLSSRARDICMLLPRFQGNSKRGRMARHPEYRYGYELFSLWLATRGESLDVLEDWPSPSCRAARPRGGRGPRPPRRPTGEHSRARSPEERP
jgi:poly(A) polymerase